MNYYIEGNPDKAEQIKAAFKKLGYDISWPEGCANPDVINIGVERNGAKYVVAETSEYIKDIIKTHPDYKRLVLPVEPKFTVGDRIIYNGIVRTITFMDEVYYDFDGGVAGCCIELQDKLKPAHNFKKGDLLVHNSEPTCRVLVVDVSEKYGYQLQDGGSRYHLSFTTIEKEYHLWTIADAKDGDVITNGKLIVIFNKLEEPTYKQHIIAYVGLDLCGRLQITEDTWQLGVDKAMPATKEQCDLLFAKMKEAGYEWDADKKELRKIQPHYDIANFKPFDKVLVRCGNDERWMIEFYCEYDTLVHTAPHRDYPFMGIGDSYSQCIPYDGNEHLLGTTDMCDEQYINW